MSAKHAEHAEAAAAELGTKAAGSNADAVREAELVVLAIPYGGAAEAVADEIRESVAGRTIIDVSNPLTPDYSGLATGERSAAEELQTRLPEARVVKAFNTVFASNQANPSREVDVFVAADHAQAKRDVIGLVESLGFSSLDVGPLSSARHLEGMAFINIGLNARNGWGWTSAWRLER